MANWLKKLTAAGVTEMIGGVQGVMEAHTGKKERDLKVAELLTAHMSAQMELIEEEIAARSKMMIAELEQDDRFTKRARPAIIYTGLLAMLVDGFNSINFTMPEMFWQGWMIAVGVYATGRTLEKVGANGGIGKFATWVTGTKKQRNKMLED